MSHLDDAIREINEENAFHLSDRAGCGDPDTRESEGAAFLVRVRNAAMEAWPRVAEGEERSDVAHEIADDAPSIYTHARWKQFVDLAAYQEEPEHGEWPEDLTAAAAIALYQIAERLVNALWEELETARNEDNDENEGDDR